jgi:hypothetical protein
MLLIKISKDDERIISRASTSAELQGIRQMILDKIAISSTLKEFNKAPTIKQPTHLGWAKACNAAKEEIGNSNVTTPPYPDNSWYARVNGVLRREGMTEESVRELAKYCKDNMRMPISFDFMICQQHRIRSGEFNVVKRRVDIVPEMPKLPEE